MGIDNGLYHPNANGEDAMHRRCLPSAVALVAAVAMTAVLSPAGRAEPTTSVDALAKSIGEISRKLPSLKHNVTDNLRPQGDQACKVFREAYARKEEFGGVMRMQLGLLGLHGGFTAGDPDVMLTGAKLFLAESRQTKLEGYAWYSLAWAGIFAGDVATAEKALKHLIGLGDKSGGFDKWAASMMPIARQCDKGVHLTLGVADGKRLTTGGLQGKAVVLEFGASQAQPWIDALVALKMFHSARKDDRGFAMVGINMDGAPEMVKEVVTKYEIPWPMVSSRKLRERFAGKGIPHVVVLSPRGRILWQGHPAATGNLALATDFARRQAALIAKAGPTSRPAGATPVKDENEKAAQAKLRLAKTYLQAGLKDRAGALLKEIVKTYPKTEAAVEATKLLAGPPAGS